MNNSQITNEQIEMGIIGSALLEPESVVSFAIKKKVLPNLFQHQHHATIWKAISDMHENSIPIDVITLSKELERRGKLSEIGGMPYLTKLLDAPITSSHAEYYINSLIESNTKKMLSELPHKINNSLKSNPSVDSAIDSTISDLKKIKEASITEDDRFPEWRYDDLVSYQVPEGHIIAGLGWLRRGCGCLLTGGTSIGKSVLAEQIAVSVAAGQNILGCIRVPSPMRVLYLQAENDQETLKRDITSIVKHLNADTKLVQDNLAIHHLYGLSGATLDNWIEQRIIKNKTDLLMLDPYQNFVPPGMNINDAGTFLAFIFNINRIIKEHNCAFLLLTHTPKPQDRENWTARESVYMAVGSQAIAAWARTSAELTGYKDDDATYRLRFGKNAERTGIVDDSGRLVRDIFIQHSPSIHEPYWQMAESQSEPHKLSKIAEKIIELAELHPSMTYREIANEIGCSTSTVSQYYPKK